MIDMNTLKEMVIEHYSQKLELQEYGYVRVWDFRVLGNDIVTNIAYSISGTDFCGYEVREDLKDVRFHFYVEDGNAYIREVEDGEDED